METAVKNNDAINILIGTLEKMDDEIESAIETLEIMADPQTLKDIEDGLQDINEGHMSTLDEFLTKHGY